MQGRWEAGVDGLVDRVDTSEDWSRCSLAALCELKREKKKKKNLLGTYDICYDRYL